MDQIKDQRIRLYYGGATYFQKTAGFTSVVVFAPDDFKRT